MQSRRTFIRQGIVVTALAAGASRAGSVFARESVAPGSRVPVLVVFDRDSPAGRSFGAAAARFGASPLPIGDDLGGAWMRTLEPRLREGPVAIAGLTAGAPLFCLEMLTRDYGLRAVRRGVHVRDVHADGAGVAAVLAGQPSMGERALPLLDLATAPEGALYSWLLAPLAGAHGALKKTHS